MSKKMFRFNINIWEEIRIGSKPLFFIMPGHAVKKQKEVPISISEFLKSRGGLNAILKKRGSHFSNSYKIQRNLNYLRGLGAKGNGLIRNFP